MNQMSCVCKRLEVIIEQESSKREVLHFLGDYPDLFHATSCINKYYSNYQFLKLSGTQITKTNFRKKA